MAALRGAPVSDRIARVCVFALAMILVAYNFGGIVWEKIYQVTR